MNLELKKRRLLARIELLKSRAGVENHNIIRKLERQLRKLNNIVD